MSKSKPPGLSVKQMIITAAISTVTSVIIMELLKAWLNRPDLVAKPSLPTKPTLKGMPGSEMASEHWRRYYN